jgi:hypothetical protein
MTKIYCNAKWCKSWEGGLCKRSDVMLYVIKEQIHCSHITRKPQPKVRLKIGKE